MSWESREDLEDAFNDFLFALTYGRAPAAREVLENDYAWTVHQTVLSAVWHGHQMRALKQKL